FTGTQTPFEVKEGPRVPEDFPDGVSNTFLIVDAGCPVPWTKPEDLVYSADEPLPPLGGVVTGRSKFKGSGTIRSKGFYAALADGSVLFVPDTTSEATIRAAITRNGGELLGEDW